MKVITVSSIKGGTGKTSHVIMVANCLGAAGYRVLGIDMDLNNAASFYYLNEQTQERVNEKNIAAAISRADNHLEDYILLTDHRGVDIIPSSLYLVDMRGVSDRRLAQMLPTISDQYDFVLIDTQPTYDNLVLAAYNASDIIITPANLCTFDYNTATFLRDKIATETDKINNWYITINGYNARYAQAGTGIQKEYIDYFQKDFALTPAQTWLPWTSAVRKITDQNMYLSDKKTGKDIVINPKLHDAVCSLAETIVGNSFFRPEEF